MGTLVRWLFGAVSVVSGGLAGLITGGIGRTILLLLFQAIEGAVIGIAVLKAGAAVYQDIDTLNQNLFGLIVAAVLGSIGVIVLIF
ncbi:MAG: hypothetical protein AB1599_09040 [Planctomycetota bacterium]